MQSTSSITEEQQLVEKLISGDRSSGRIFLEQYGDLIWSIIHVIDNRSNTMESEDLFMETLKHLFDNDYKVLKQLWSIFQANGTINCSLSKPNNQVLVEIHKTISSGSGKSAAHAIESLKKEAVRVAIGELKKVF